MFLYFCGKEECRTKEKKSMEALSFDNILGENEIDTLFTDPEDTTAQEEQNNSEEENNDNPLNSDKEKNEKETTEVVDPETMFEEETPESVGSGKDKEGKEDTVTDEEADGTSPNNNFYSSIANALAVDGIFPNLDDETVKKAVDAESFSDLIEAEINARFDEKQQRISKALENGVEPTDTSIMCVGGALFGGEDWRSREIVGRVMKWRGFGLTWRNVYVAYPVP